MKIQKCVTDLELLKRLTMKDLFRDILCDDLSYCFPGYRSTIVCFAICLQRSLPFSSNLENPHFLFYGVSLWWPSNRTWSKLIILLLLLIVLTSVEYSHLLFEQTLGSILWDPFTHHSAILLPLLCELLERVDCIMLPSGPTHVDFLKVLLKSVSEGYRESKFIWCSYE